MITEDYVSFETAKLLKEKGFDYPTETGYNKDGRTIERAYNIGERSICGDAYNWNKEETYYSHPTLWEAMRWLRKVYGLFIRITEDMTGNVFEWSVYQKNYGCKASTFVEDSYELACETAIKYCLENLIRDEKESV